MNTMLSMENSFTLNLNRLDNLGDFTSDLARSLDNATIDFAVAEELQTVHDVNLISESAINNFYGLPLFEDLPISNSGFIKFTSDQYECREEAFDMQQFITHDELVGGSSISPSFPSLVSLDLISCLNLLTTYTNNLEELRAPPELCVQKAIELIGNRSNYNLNLEAFRLEMISDNVGESGMRDVNALVKGIDCIASYLLKYFDEAARMKSDLFPYEFYCLLHDRYLFLSKITLNAQLSIPPRIPTAVARPAYTYPEVQERVRKTDITETYYCPVI